LNFLIVYATNLFHREGKNMTNTILPFLLNKTNIRGRIVKLDSLVNNILSAHDYPEIVNSYLAELIAISSSLAGIMDFEGIFTLQTSGDGYIPMMVVDIDSNGNIRAYAKHKDNIPEEADFNEIMGKGYIAFTIDTGKNAKKYQGLVELQQGSFENCIKHYFESSEQIETSIKAAAEKIDGIWKAGALIIQKLPEEEKSDFNETNIYLETCLDSELVDNKISSKDLLYRLFHELTITVYDEKELQDFCRCSEDKIKSFLKTISKEEIEELGENGVIDITCEFCGKLYKFNTKDF